MSTQNTLATKALIIMAHGSRRASANEEFFAFVESVTASAHDYACVKPALLEQAAPTLLQASHNLPDDITHIDVYPLFFNQGKHVEKDIPAQVVEVMEAHPDKTVDLLTYFGRAEGLGALVLNHISAQTAIDELE